MLALLLLDANVVVPRERLIDALWGERPPATAPKLVQTYVSGLRKALGDAGDALETRSPGYLLRVADGELDLLRFERLAATGRAALAEGDAGEASARLQEALAMRRGAALADVAFDAPAAEAERAPR